MTDGRGGRADSSASIVLSIKELATLPENKSLETEEELKIQVQSEECKAGETIILIQTELNGHVNQLNMDKQRCRNKNKKEKKNSSMLIQKIVTHHLLKESKLMDR